MTAENFLALWEASLFHALRGCTGVPTIIVSTAALGPEQIYPSVKLLYEHLVRSGSRGRHQG